MNDDDELELISRQLRAAEAQLSAERDSHEKTRNALIEKDAAMSVLFQRLVKADVDVSDLIP